MRTCLALLTIGCGASSVQPGTSSGQLTFLDDSGTTQHIVLDGGALVFECGRCDDLWVVLTDQPKNFGCEWAHANYGTGNQRVPDRGGSHYNLFWDGRYPDTLQVVRARVGLQAWVDDRAETYVLPAQMVWDEIGTRGALWVEDQEPLRFEAESCGLVE